MGAAAFQGSLPRADQITQGVQPLQEAPGSLREIGGLTSKTVVFMSCLYLSQCYGNETLDVTPCGPKVRRERERLQPRGTRREPCARISAVLLWDCSAGSHGKRRW